MQRKKATKRNGLQGELPSSPRRTPAAALTAPWMHWEGMGVALARRRSAARKWREIMRLRQGPHPPASLCEAAATRARHQQPRNMVWNCWPDSAAL